jgi:hypothetical protein
MKQPTTSRTTQTHNGGWLQRLVRCHGLFANIQQTIKNAGCSLSAALVCYGRQIICSKRNNTNRQLRIPWVCQVVLCLGFAALLSCGSKASVIAPSDSTINESTLLLNPDLHIRKPSRECVIISPINRRPESADSAAKLRPSVSVVGIPSQTITNEKAKKDANETNQRTCKLTRHILIFVVCFIIGLLLGYNPTRMTPNEKS